VQSLLFKFSGGFLGRGGRSRPFQTFASAMFKFVSPWSMAVLLPTKDSSSTGIGFLAPPYDSAQINSICKD